MRNLSLLAACGLLSASFVSAQINVTYTDPTAPIEKRVDDLLGRMTPEEKLSLLGGTGFTTQPIRADV